VRDLGCGGREVYLDFEMHRVICETCGVKNEKLDFLSDNTRYTLRFAMQIGGLCRAMTITDVARLMHLDWHTVKALDKACPRESGDLHARTTASCRAADAACHRNRRNIDQEAARIPDHRQ
jgi:transposase